MYTTRGGRIKGRIISQVGGGAVVRLAQHHTFITPDVRMRIAKAMVDAKICNQRYLIERHRRHYPQDEYDQAIAKINSYQMAAQSADNIDELMGFEGVSAKTYWDCYRRMLKYPDFTRRDYRPAPDYVNSALNLGYAFLANEITTCLAALHFDLEIGFLHSIHYGRNSLTLDIMEEFRSPFVDSWLLGLFNRRILKKEHFMGVEDGFYLNEDGFAKFISLYHEHLEQGKWRSIFRRQSDNLKKAVMESAQYRPFRCG